MVEECCMHQVGFVRKTIANCKVFTTSGISEPSAVLDTIGIGIKATQQHY